MGRGNVCVTGKYEGLFYIDNNDYCVYRLEDYGSDEPVTALMRELDFSEITGPCWYYDEYGTAEELDDILQCLSDEFSNMFPSFSKPAKDVWLGNANVLLESKLFYIAAEDNQWSVAVKLLQKEDPYGFNWMENLQARLYKKYLEGIKRCLLNRIPSIGTYAGAWTSGTLRREDLE